MSGSAKKVHSFGPDQTDAMESNLHESTSVGTYLGRQGGRELGSHPCPTNQHAHTTPAVGSRALAFEGRFPPSGFVGGLRENQTNRAYHRVGKMPGQRTWNGVGWLDQDAIITLHQSHHEG